MAKRPEAWWEAVIREGLGMWPTIGVYNAAAQATKQQNAKPKPKPSEAFKFLLGKATGRMPAVAKLTSAQFAMCQVLRDTTQVREISRRLHRTQAHVKVMLRALRQHFGVRTLAQLKAHLDRAGVFTEQEWLLNHRAQVLMHFREQLNRQPMLAVERPDVSRWAPVYAAEAFAGGGLFSLAAYIEGITIQQVCEMAPWALKSLAANGAVGGTRVDPGSVGGGRKLTSIVDAQDALKWTPKIPEGRLAHNGGGLDVLMGGPPCQPFSAGANLGGGALGAANPKNMFPRILDWIADSQPRVVVMENAATLLTGKHLIHYFENWKHQVSLLGYEVVTWVLLAQDYGSPQNRKRLFAVCFPKGAEWGQWLQDPPRPSHARPNSPATNIPDLLMRPPKGMQEQTTSAFRLPWVSAYARLNSGCCGGFGLVGCRFIGNFQNQCTDCHNGDHFEAADNQSDSQAGRAPSPSVIKDALGWVKKKRGKGMPTLKHRRPTPASRQAANVPRPPHIFGSVPAREDWHRTAITQYLAPTVMAGAGTQRALDALLMPAGTKGRVGTIDFHDEEQVKAFVAQLRELSVREAAKLQDVPNWYSFKGGRGAAYRQVGNGIPVNMGRAVLRQIRRALGRKMPAENYGLPVPKRDIQRGNYGQTPPGWTVNNGLWPSGNPWPMVYNGMCTAYQHLGPYRPDRDVKALEAELNRLTSIGGGERRRKVLLKRIAELRQRSNEERIVDVIESLTPIERASAEEYFSRRVRGPSEISQDWGPASSGTQVIGWRRKPAISREDARTLEPVSDVPLKSRRKERRRRRRAGILSIGRSPSLRRPGPSSTGETD